MLPDAETARPWLAKISEAGYKMTDQTFERSCINLDFL